MGPAQDPPDSESRLTKWVAAHSLRNPFLKKPRLNNSCCYVFWASFLVPSYEFESIVHRFFMFITRESFDLFSTNVAL